MSFDMGDYVDVATRISIFREKYPEGSLQPWNPEKPYTIEEIGGKLFIIVVAAAYRTADDQRPGIGMAQEQFPGTTNFTRNSEVMNAESSAWGRAIVAVLAADTKKGVASADEVRNRREEQERPLPPDPLQAAKSHVWQLAQAKGFDREDLANDFASWCQDGDVTLATASPDDLGQYAKTLEPTTAVRRNGS